MKRYVTAVLALAMTAALASCGTNSDDTAATEMPSPTEAEQRQDDNDGGDNIIDDTGDAVRDIGDGASDVVDDAGDAVRDAGDGVSNAVKDME